MAVLRLHLILCHLYKISAQPVFVLIHNRLIFMHQRDLRFIIIMQQRHRRIQCLAGHFCHMCTGDTALVHCKRRILQETVILCRQSLQCTCCALLVLAIAHGKDRQTLQYPVERKPDHSCKNIKGRMNHCDTGCICRILQEGKMYKHIRRVEQNHEHNRTDQIKIQMYKCGTLRIFLCSDRGNERCHTRTDILSHNNRERRTVRDRSGHTQCLQNTNRCRRALNNRCQQCTCQHTENRILKHQKDIRKLRNIRKRLYRTAHRLHTKHQHRKADHDRACILLLILFRKQQKADTNDRQDRGK